MWSMPTARSASAPSQRSTEVERRSVIVDLPSGGREDVPLGAELIQPLSVGVARPAVADVVVERVLCVGDLAPAVRPADRSDLRARCAGTHVRVRAGDQSGPHAEACARAPARAGLVALEELEGAAAAVDKDPSKRGPANADPRAGTGRAQVVF